MQRKGKKRMEESREVRNMSYKIREIQEAEYSLLEDFIYLAIYVPEGKERPPREITKTPEQQVYIRDFGKGKNEYGFVAVTEEEEVVGAVWGRIMHDFGHIDDQTPSLALSIREGHRGKGLGTALLNAFIEKLRQEGFSYVSLSVQKSNPALRLYQRLGFEQVGTTMGETEEEIIMRRPLQ